MAKNKKKNRHVEEILKRKNPAKKDINDILDDDEVAEVEEEEVEVSKSSNLPVISIGVEEDEEEYEEEDVDTVEEVNPVVETEANQVEEEEDDEEEVAKQAFEVSCEGLVDIDTVDETLLDVVVRQMFQIDATLTHRVVASIMVTSLKDVAMFLYNWYDTQDKAGITKLSYQEMKSKVYKVLRNRFGKFNDEEEFCHLVAHWFVNGVLGLRKQQ